MRTKAERIPARASTAVKARGRLLSMTTARADKHDLDVEESGGVILSPEEEAELEQVIAETDEDERAGRCIPWEQFLAERAIRRGR